MRVPLAWVDAQYGGPVAGLGPILDLYRAWARGESGASLPHARELGSARAASLRRAHAGPLALDPLPAHLTAQGRYELQDGHHRAARRVLEGEATLELDVRAVSPLWQRFMDDLAAIYRQRVLYQGIEHPSFDDWPRDRSDARYPLLLQGAGVPRSNASWLDVGSCTGRICREARRAGWLRVAGIDCDPVVLRVAEYLDTVFGTRCAWHLGEDPMQVLGSGWGWDVVSCLSVFHRRLAAGEERQVGELFRAMAVRSRVFLTDAASPSDASCRGRDWRGHGGWLARVTGRPVRALGATEGRTIYAVG